MSGRNVIRFDFLSGLWVTGRCLILIALADLDCHNLIGEWPFAEHAGLHHILEVDIGSADSMGLREALKLLAGGSGVVGDLGPS